MHRLTRRELLRFGLITSGSVALIACQQALGKALSNSAPPLARTPEAEATTVPQSELPPVAAGKAPEILARPGEITVTPNDDFYTVAYRFDKIDLRLDQWQLEVGGAVQTPQSYTIDELRAMPSVTEMRTLECISNPIGGNLISNAWWKGVPMRSILEQAGVKPSGIELKIESADGYSTSIPLALAMHPHSLLAYEMNGVPLPPEHGFPLRCLWPGRYGMKQPKWVQHLTVVENPYRGYWELQGWSNDAFIKVNSQIRMPETGELTLSNAPITIAGTAFSGEAGIARIEVSTDDGQTWQEARLTRGPQPFTPYVWTEWRYDWMPAAEGNYTLAVRATDNAGNTQEKRGFSLLGGTYPDGTNGIHSISAQVRKG